MYRHRTTIREYLQVNQFNQTGLHIAIKKDFSLSKRITLILCLIYAAQVTARDSLVEMFLKQMRSINNDATKELELIKKRIQETQEKLVGVLTNVIHVFMEENQLNYEPVSSLSRANFL